MTGTVVRPHKRLVGCGCVETRLAAVELEPTHRAHEFFRIRQLQQGPMGAIGWVRQGREVTRDPLHAAGPTGLEKAQHPGGKARQIRPADLQRAHGIEQHARHATPESRRRSRHGGTGDDAAGVAEGGGSARRTRVDQRDAKAPLLQLQRGRRADDTGADQQTMRLGRQGGRGGRHEAGLSLDEEVGAATIAAQACRRRPAL